MGSKAAGAASVIGGAFVAATAAAVAAVGGLALVVGKLSFDFALESDTAMKTYRPK